MYRKTVAEINFDHLAHNIRLLQRSFPKTPFLCPMIKASAYGHGDIKVAHFLEDLGVRQLGVCLVEEGLTIRNSGVKAEILVFGGFDAEGAEKIIQYQMTPVVSSWRQLELLEAMATSPLGIHVKFDTGMKRLGFSAEDADKLYSRLWQNKKLRLKALLTHLLQGDDANSLEGRSAEQLRLLHEISLKFSSFNIFCHALNSAGIINSLKMRGQKEAPELEGHPLFLQNWGLRPGLMIYGCNPVEHAACDLKQVMTFKSVVSTFRKVKTGESVSYSGTWRASKDSVIAVVPAGYADGYHRILSNRGIALFNGMRVPVVGNVCMDYLMLDVTEAIQGVDLDKLHQQEVVLFGTDSGGGNLSASELAERAGSISYEMLTSVSQRVPRVYKGSETLHAIENSGGE